MEPRTDPDKMLGKHVEKQKEVYEKLQDEGPFEYDELLEKAGVENETMQEVIRGLRDNGLIQSHRENKEWIYYAKTSE